MNKKNKARAFSLSLSLSFGEGWGGALILIIIFTISSCRKYPEGGSYFLSNMDNKIKGTYNFTHYYINGVDSVNYYFYNNNFVGELRILGYKGNYELHIGYNHFNDNNAVDFGLGGASGEWYWYKKNKSFVKFTFKKTEGDSIIYAGPLSEEITSIWDIKKLKDDELIIEADYNNKHYRAELKK